MAATEYTGNLHHRAVLCAVEELARQDACSSRRVGGGAGQAAATTSNSPAALHAHRDLQALLAAERLGIHAAPAANAASAVSTGAAAVAESDNGRTVVGKLLRSPLKELACSLNRGSAAPAAAAAAAAAQGKSGALQQQQQEEEELAERVSQQLAATCWRLSEAAGCSGASAAELPGSVAALAARVASLAARRDELRLRLAGERARYAALLADAASSLAAALAGHRAKEGKASTSATLELLEATGSMLAAKLQVLHKRILADTYTGDAVDALRAVDAELRRASAEAADALQKATAKLATYDGLGPEYDELAARYGALAEELGHARYALVEMHELQEGI